MCTEKLFKKLFRPPNLSRLVFLVALLALVCHAGLAVQYGGGHGFNYNAYRYFSGIFWQGQNPYQAPDVAIKDINESYKKPEYLDYTGAQLFIYNFCEYMTSHSGVDGFIAYSLFLFLIAIVLVRKLKEMVIFQCQEYICFVAFLFLPYLWYVLFFRSYEDKVFYILLPLVLLYLHQKSIKATGLFLGLSTGMLGVAIAIYPLLGISLLQEQTFAWLTRWKKLFVLTCYMIWGLVIAFVPFFPDSLIGWQRRSVLESSSPIWFSFWNFVQPFYLANLNKIAIIIFCLVVYVLFLLKWLEFKTATILVLSSFFIFSLTMGPQRIMPLVVVFVLAFRQAKPRLIYCGVAFALSFVFYYLDKYCNFFHYPETLTVAQIKSAVLLSPILLGYCLIFWDNFIFSQNKSKS